MIATPPLIQNERVLDSLRRIVKYLTTDSSAQEDLMQEGLIYLWLSEEQSPGQRPSWYLQGCRFRLQHYLSTGRSVDSSKRRCYQLLLQDEQASSELFELLQENAGQFEHVSARDIVWTISASLTERERAVLLCLADGLSALEIARKLHLSTPTVTKYRRRIARIAERLGILEDCGGGCAVRSRELHSGSSSRATMKTVRGRKEPFAELGRDSCSGFFHNS